MAAWKILGGQVMTVTLEHRRLTYTGALTLQPFGCASAALIPGNRVQLYRLGPNQWQPAAAAMHEMCAVPLSTSHPAQLRLLLMPLTFCVRCHCKAMHAMLPRCPWLCCPLVRLQAMMCMPCAHAGTYKIHVPAQPSDDVLGHSEVLRAACSRLVCLGLCTLQAPSCACTFMLIIQLFKT